LGRERITIRAALITVTMLALIAPAPEAAGRSAVTGVNSISVFTLNVRYFEFGYQKFGDRLANGYRVAPDLILLQEAPLAHMRAFVSHLETAVGIDYSWRHSDPGDARRIDGTARDVAILWRKHRFNLSALKRWRRIGAADLASNGGTKCFKHGNRNRPILGPPQLALRLWDSKKKRHVYVASLHFPAYVVEHQREDCMTANLVRMGNRLDSMGRVRRLTIAGGDLNIPPDDPQRWSGPTAKWRTEADPNCWYRLLVPDVSDGPVCDRADHPRLPRAYYDAVRTKHFPEICPQWSHGGQAPVPYPPERDLCTSDTRRKDYVLFRYESRHGRALTERDGWSAKEMIKRARSDRGYIFKKGRATRYSDHRAVQAVFRYQQ
jgi:hypothetical protein